MRNEAILLFKEQLEAVRHDIETCEIEMADCTDDADALTALATMQAKFESVADELETQIQKLR